MLDASMIFPSSDITINPDTTRKSPSSMSADSSIGRNALGRELILLLAGLGVGAALVFFVALGQFNHPGAWTTWGYPFTWRMAASASPISSDPPALYLNVAFWLGLSLSVMQFPVRIAVQHLGSAFSRTDLRLSVPRGPAIIASAIVVAALLTSASGFVALERATTTITVTTTDTLTTTATSISTQTPVVTSFVTETATSTQARTITSMSTSSSNTTNSVPGISGPFTLYVTYFVANETICNPYPFLRCAWSGTIQWGSGDSYVLGPQTGNSSWPINNSCYPITWDLAMSSPSNESSLSINLVDHPGMSVAQQSTNTTSTKVSGIFNPC
jgi:hypothetical protein